MKELIEFAVFLTGHDKETVEQMYNDWKNICLCGTEEYSESKPRRDDKWYCSRCNQPY